MILVSAAGTGKTYGVLSFLHCLARDNAGLRILFARGTRSALTDSVLADYEQLILPLDGLEGMAEGVTRRVRQSYRYANGTEIVVRGLDDPSRVRSTAWDFVYVNEATETTEDAWQAIKARLNRPGRSSRFGYLIGDCNPDHPAHWIKRRIDEKLTASWTVDHEANPAMYTGTDWTDAGLGYLATLDGLVGTMRERFRFGRWAAGAGAWFGDCWDEQRHVAAWADHDESLPTEVAIDPGVFTGAVFYQIRPGESGPVCTVFGDYLSENRSARDNATAVRALAGTLCGGRIDRAIADPASKARTAIGTTVLSEYAQAGLPLSLWPSPPHSVGQGLALIESLLASPGGPPRLVVHPRCKYLRDAFTGYMRAKRGGQWADFPEDPQHPHEDVMDALRGGLFARFGGRVHGMRMVYQ